MAETIAGSTSISAADYLAHYAEQRFEWVRGALQPTSPISLKHDRLDAYLRYLLAAYLALRPVGVLVGDPFVMRLEALDVFRQPDLQVILHTNPGQLTETVMLGPADICIEVVSPDSVVRDYGEKFAEYEQAGVPEYWIIDPQRQMAIFYRLSAEGVYTAQPPHADACYHTPRLPGLVLHVPTLWQDPLPDLFAITDAVRAMLAG